VNNHVIKFAKDQGHKGIKLLLWRTNTTAKKIYERLGFNQNPCEYFYYYFLEVINDIEDSDERMKANYAVLEQGISSALGSSQVQQKDKIVLTEVQNLNRKLLGSTKWPEMQSLVRSSEPQSEDDIKSLVFRYLERSSKSGSCLAITRIQEAKTEVVGLILTVDELQNWGSGSYTTVTDIFLAQSLFQNQSGSNSEASRALLLQIYLRFLGWLKNNKRVMVNWAIDNFCQEQIPLSQMFSKLLPELCLIEKAYDSMTLAFS